MEDMQQAVSPQGSNLRAMRLPRTGQQLVASCEDSSLELVRLTSINLCTATFDLLTKVSYLPEDLQVQTFSSLPRRFLCTLCCLAMEGVADVLPLSPSAATALLRIGNNLRDGDVQRCRGCCCAIHLGRFCFNTLGSVLPDCSYMGCKDLGGNCQMALTTALCGRCRRA